VHFFFEVISLFLFDNLNFNAVDHNKLKLIVKLQLLDDELDEILSEQQGLPEEIHDLEKDVVSITEQLETRKNQEEENLKIKQRLNEEITAANSKIEKFKDSQTTARNNKEYDALSKQIEYEEQEIKKAEGQIRTIDENKERQSEMEDRGRRLMDENRYDELTDEMMPTDILESQLSDVKEELSNKKEELNEIIEETQDEVKQIQEKIARQREVVLNEAKPILDKYDHLRNGGVQNAIVKLHRHACSGCNTYVPTNRHAFILQGGFYSCETCGRIVVHERLFEEALTVEA
jgi:hypothetical protein